MRYLMLLLLIACGKHEMPAAPDIGDSDGDQKVNFEDGEDKYVAEVIPLKEVRGILSFSANGGSPLELQFTNRTDPGKMALEMLTRNGTSLKEDEHFIEFSKLRLEKPMVLPPLSDSVTVKLNFTVEGMRPSSLWMRNGKAERKLSGWSKDMSVAMTKEDLTALLHGESTLHLSSEWMEKAGTSVRNNTYRVFTYDGREGKFFYVSKELPYASFLTKLGIPDPRPIEGKELFTMSGETKGAQWWSRTLDESSWVVVSADLPEIIKAYKKGFLQKEEKIVRSDRGSKTTVTIKKKKEAMLYLTIHGSLDRRHFIERIETEHYSRRLGGQGEGSIQWNCDYLKREVSHETTEFLSFAQLRDEIKLTSNGIPVPLQSGKIVAEGLENGHKTWTLGFLIATETLLLEIKDKVSATSVITGLYDLRCSRGGEGPRHSRNTSRTPEEARMEIHVESFVENL